MAPRASLGRSTPLLLATAILLFTSDEARAADPEPWSASIGQFDFGQEEQALEFGIDYRFRRVFFSLEPIVGLGVTTEGSVYGYGGLARPFELWHSAWYLVPNFAVSLYEDGEGKDLGQPLEFRSGLELFYVLPRGTRVGLGFYHLSNASMDDVNPGANSLLLRVVLPRDK